MSSSTRRLTQPERVEISNRRMLDAAAALVAEKGWEATTAAEIGRRAGYSRAMVHARYGGKEALLSTLFRQAYEERLSPREVDHASGLDRALGHFATILDLFNEDPDYVRAMFVLAFHAVTTDSPLRPHMQTWLTSGAQIVEKGLRDGIADGSVRPGIDVADAARIISASIFGIAFQWTVMPNHHDFADELTQVKRRFEAEFGLKAPQFDRTT